MSTCCENLPAPGTESFPENIGWLRLGLAIVVAGLSMQFSLGVNLEPISGNAHWLVHGTLALAAVLVFALLGGPILRASLAAARARRLTLDQLFLVGIAGAFAASLHSTLSGTGAIYYEVVAVLVAIRTFGEIILSRQQHRTQATLRDLTSSLRTATRLTCCGQPNVVPLVEVRAGDRILITPGERLPVDGTILEGTAYVQEIAHTGEPFPAVRAPGDHVLAGSRALDGQLIVAATHDGHDRELDRLATRLDAALAVRSQWQREADRWISWFLPSILAIALGTLLFWTFQRSFGEALFYSLSVLLVACPCGLGLGVPLAVSHAMHRLAALGIVPSNPNLIDRLARVTSVVFDKTGTLTEEHLHLRALVSTGDRTALLRRLTLIQSHSAHPVARPFTAHFDTPAPEHLLSLEALPGRGVRARLDTPEGERILSIGNALLLTQAHQPTLDTLRSHTTTVSNRELFIFDSHDLVGLALLEETVRPAVGGLLGELRTAGFRVELMTGDASPDLEWKALGIPVQAGLTTAEKGAAIRVREQAGERILFIGDGLNDSEAISTATAALALNEGDTTARASADGELSPLALGNLPQALALAQSTRRTIRRILTFALAYNILGITLAATALLNPIFAAILMFASSATVIKLATQGSEGNSAVRRAPPGGRA